MKNEIHFIKNYDLSKRSWIKSGGSIKVFIKPKKNEEIKKVLSYLNKESLGFYTIGNTSNIIIRDGEIKTPFINLNKLNKIKAVNSKLGLHLFVEAGVSIPIFSKFVLKKGYTGTEGLFGIPGSVGGGIFMNASSFEYYLSKFLCKVVSIDCNGNTVIKKKKEIDFSWRYSSFQKSNEIITGAYFFFPKSNLRNSKDLENKLNKFIYIRKKFQENEHPNLGSLFATKNIYSDIKFDSILFFLFFVNYKIINFIFYKKFLNKNLILMRKYLNYMYILNFDLKKNRKFSLSNKKINFIINKGSRNSNDGIDLIQNIQSKINNKIKLENIVLKDIK